MFLPAWLFALALSLNVYAARVERVVDGDTVTVRIQIWDNQELLTAIRLRGIDAPEIRGKCPAERELARRAKARAAELMPPGSIVTLTRIKADKYGGRYDAEITLADGRKVAEVLIAESLAREYSGAVRQGWC